jgi:hypothetical protein
LKEENEVYVSFKERNQDENKFDFMAGVEIPTISRDLAGEVAENLEGLEAVPIEGVDDEIDPAANLIEVPSKREELMKQMWMMLLMSQTT